ncbi:MAG: acyl-CoA dehydratase activase [Thermoanaerobaculia bacterium]|nr:acyl-CoA dehydratase activase [Thermoanaerobaculia bacterium]
MIHTAGIDVGSTYTKAVVLTNGTEIVGKALAKTGFRLPEVSERLLAEARREAGLEPEEISYVVATGFGRHQVPVRDVQVTDLTAAARGATFFFPETRTILDIGGQTMKASRLDESAKVRSFRLNDKCAAGTGAFIEKTARYMGYETDEIGPLAATSKDPVPISGVCAVFAESEVINHLSFGRAPADIMQGSILSLVGRSVQLMKRVRMEPQYTLLGGILRFPTMVTELESALGDEVNVPRGDMVQFCSALGAARLGYLRQRRRADGTDREVA